MAPKSNGHPSLLLPLFLSIMPVLSARLAAARSPPSSPPPPPPNSQFGYLGPTNFSPSMAIVIIVLIAAFFFLGFFSIYIRRCSSEPAGEGGPTVRTPGANRQQRGLDPAMIKIFPTMVYSEVKAHKAGKGALECAICLSEFEDDELLKLLPKCSHVFHPDCIDAWLADHVTCPVCRSDLTLLGNEEVLNQDAATVDHESSAESTAAITRQEEEISGDPPALPADAVVAEVETESEEEKKRKEEAVELERIRMMRRAMRSKSSWQPPRFPRSHSTGHSLSIAAGTGDDGDRYTLRIPEQVLRQIIAEGKLKRSTSLYAYRETGEGSSRPGYRGNGEGSSRGGRGVRMFVRNLSEKFSSWGIGRRGEGEGSAKGEGSTGRGRLGSVRVQFDCLAGGAVATAKADSGESSVGRRVDRVNAD